MARVTRYMLDTNMVSHLARGHPAVVERLATMAMDDLCISAITEGELRFGLAKRPAAKRLHHLVEEFLKRVDVLPWDSVVAAGYGTLRADMQRQGRSLGSLDLLIAAHAKSAGMVLVTSDQAFGMVDELIQEDWSAILRG